MSDPLQLSLLVVALAFAFVNGANDGGALLSVGLSVRSIRPVTGLLVLTGCVLVAPILVGTQVAVTLVDRLVSLDGSAGRLALLIGVVVAVVVTHVLSRRGLPTSLTLALVGAIAGVGVGSGLPVDGRTVALVLTLAALAPLVGLGGARFLAGLAARRPSSADLGERVRRWHAVGFVAQCIAYGANDGQKMLAVVAVAAGTTGVAGQGIDLVPWQLAAIGGCFLLGAVTGLPRIAGTLGSGVVPIRPPDAVITELSAATVVLGTAAVGAPVSMTQSIGGALIGTGMVRGPGRVRWGAAARIGGAWFVTLPAAFLAAAVVGATVTALT